MRSLITSDTTIKVSSTLDKSVGKKYLTDGSPETCWTSQQGLPQWIQLTFPQPIVPQRLSLIFQGGFVGTRCAIQIPSSISEAGNSSSPDPLAAGTTPKKLRDWTTQTQVFPEDVNRRQSFDLPPQSQDEAKARGGVEALRLVFEESSDFFGRITVYDLVLEGDLVEGSPDT
ncbi:hypothetical protein AX16_000389 [Volvariella volvacea WC 439]|nr:hypothetical protein AX16_000389 [Volvariella volvacea WC 439]